MTALRALTPVGWLVVVAALLATSAVVLGGLGFRWDPFDLNRRRLDRAEASVAAAQAEAIARSAEATAQAAQIVRLDDAVQARVALQRATSLSLQDARTADDASVALSPDRLDRLRAHDDELCRLAPNLDGCAATPDPAADGGAALRPASLAAEGYAWRPGGRLHDPGTSDRRL